MIISIISKEKKESAQLKQVRDLLRLEKNNQFICEQSGSIYHLEGTVNLSETQSIAQQLLCDVIIEKFEVNSLPKSAQIIFADVRYKPGVTDTVGESVQKAIRDLGVQSVKQASSGTRYVFKLNAKIKIDDSLLQNIQQFANRHLLNPLVQECKITKL